MKKANNQRWDNFKGLAGKRIVTVRGWSYGKRWEAMAGVLKAQVSTMMQGFYLLDIGRVIGVIGYNDSFDYRLKMEGIDHKYRKSPVMELVIDYIIGIQTEPTRRLISEFDKGKRTLVQNGMMAKIYARWAPLGINIPADTAGGAQ